MVRPLLSMDELQPVFNAVEGEDFGPGTGRQIRYPIRDFKKLLQRFLKGYITHEGDPWEGPFAAVFSLWEDAGHTGTNQHTATVKSAEPYNKYSLAGSDNLSAATGNVSDNPDFFDPLNPVEGGACPIIDPDTGERETAHLVEFATALCSIAFDLFTPATEQASWEEATHVWLNFDVTMGGQTVFSYVCATPEVHGNVNGLAISNNVLGIDYADGGGGFDPPFTDSIPIGDGTTAVFLWTPTNDRATLDSLETREGLDD